MVVLPSPYAYAWFEAPREYNLEVKVGCKDPNSVDYCEDCQVEDNSRCGPCNAGWTKINDPNIRKCFYSIKIRVGFKPVFYKNIGNLITGKFFLYAFNYDFKKRFYKKFGKN